MLVLLLPLSRTLNSSNLTSCTLPRRQSITLWQQQEQQRLSEWMTDMFGRFDKIAKQTVFKLKPQRVKRKHTSSTPVLAINFGGLERLTASRNLPPDLTRWPNGAHRKLQSNASKSGLYRSDQSSLRWCAWTECFFADYILSTSLTLHPVFMRAGRLLLLKRISKYIFVLQSLFYKKQTFRCLLEPSSVTTYNDSPICFFKQILENEDAV